MSRVERVCEYGTEILFTINYLCKVIIFKIIWSSCLRKMAFIFKCSVFSLANLEKLKNLYYDSGENEVLFVKIGARDLDL